jgi:hypothetical protein
MQTFAAGAMELQEKRHAADYDPLPWFTVSDARLAIGAARNAVGRFGQVPPDLRKTFLTLLLCPPR